MIFHCFFEQSGTFKNVFKKLGFQAYDYDILNNFNETDYIVDLFSEIENAYLGLPSLFDTISERDLVFAFFPCTRFSPQAVLLLNSTQKQLSNLSDLDKLKNALTFHNELHFLYCLFCKFCFVCLKAGIKLIIENPYSQFSYLTRYFPLKPKVIDMDRTNRGDYYKKPTQYWFINCEPKINFVAEAYSIGGGKFISNVSNKVERSLISSDYAERFIKEFIL